jgi:L-alanine-DL-glutamate epimerase-like enolase superfamily enzyme
LRADANNVWSDPSSCITALSALGNPFWAVEEPLARGDVHGMRRVANSLRVPVILDESLLSVQQLDAFSSDATNWIANIRVSKAGGILRAIDLAREAHTRGLGIIVGAHVGESSLLTRAALCVAQSVRPHVLAQEGAYGHLLLAHDLTTPSLCFGAGGQLDLNRGGIQRRSGMGLTLNAPRITWVGVSA